MMRRADWPQTQLTLFPVIVFIALSVVSFRAMLDGLAVVFLVIGVCVLGAGVWLHQSGRPRAAAAVLLGPASILLVFSLAIWLNPQWVSYDG